MEKITKTLTKLQQNQQSGSRRMSHGQFQYRIQLKLLYFNVYTCQWIQITLNVISSSSAFFSIFLLIELYISTGNTHWGQVVNTQWNNIVFNVNYMVTNFAENLYHRWFNQAGVCVSRHFQKELLKAKKNIKVKFDCQLHSELFHKIDKLNNLAKFSFYFVLHRNI